MRRRRYSWSIPDLIGSSLTSDAYYKMRNAGELGQAIEVTLKCDGYKMHKVTFYERGPVKLHHHNLRAERALGELGQENLPRCVVLLNAWKESNVAFKGAYPEIAQRMMRILSMRNKVAEFHTVAKHCVDVDGLDIKQPKRLLALINGKEHQVKEKIKRIFHYEDTWRDPINYDYPAMAGIHQEKIKISIQGIGAPSDSTGKPRPSMSTSKPTKPKVLPQLNVKLDTISIDKIMESIINT